MRRSLLFILTIFFLQYSYAQLQAIKPLRIGDKIPTSIWNTIPKKRTTKLIILDFWVTTCSSCIAAFPEMAKLQKEFPDKLQIVLVNCAENDSKIKEKLDKINTNRIDKENLVRIPVAVRSLTGKIIFKQLFPYIVLPQHIWLDENGKVIAITHGYNATKEHVASFLNGKQLNMVEKNDMRIVEFGEKGFIQSSLNSMPPPLFYSVFTSFYSLSNFDISYHVDSVSQTFRFGFYNKSLYYFLTSAFNNEKERRVVNEMRNKEILDRPEDNNLVDEWERKYCFSYEAQIPLIDQNNTLLRSQMMQQDFSRYFGNLLGIEAIVKKRKFKSLILVKTKEGLLKASADKEPFQNSSTETYGVGKFDGLTIINNKFHFLTGSLGQLENMNELKPFIDESGISPDLKVDIRITGDLHDVQNVRNQIHQYGLDIIEAEREVEVLVIRDKK